MKKRAIITYLLAFALFLSACVYRIPEETEGSSNPALQQSEIAPSSSDTSAPSQENEATQPTYYYSDWPDIEEPIYTEDDVIFTENGIIAGPFTFEYVDDTYTFFMAGLSTRLNGLNLVACDTDATEVVIPSVVCNIPVVAIAYHHRYSPPLEEPVFTNSPSLTILYIPDAVLYIDEAAFAGCNKLTDVRLSNCIEYLGADNSDSGELMFSDTSVKFLEVPEGVLCLGYYTFLDSDIEYMILPSTLTEILTNALTRCSLRHIYIRAAEWHYNDDLLEELYKETNATIYFYSETEPTEEGNFWHYVDGKPVIW